MDAMVAKNDFFIPAAADAAQAERLYQTIIEFTGAGPQKRRIQRLTYKHNGMLMEAEVGKSPAPYYRESGPVIAILDSNNCYFICCPDRGVIRGSPIYASGNGSPTYFDEA